MDQGLRLQLLQLINKPEWTEEEREWLLVFLQTDEADSLRAILYESFQQQLATPLTEEEHALAEAMLQNIHARLGFINPRQQAPRISRRLVIYVAAVAAVLIFVIGFSLMYRHQDSIPQATSANVSKADVAPGGNNALLTLSDGSTVILEKSANGLISVQGGTQVSKTASGKLLYQTDQKTKAAVVGMNQLTTPRGGQYYLVLPDGTEVWLNAASKLIYPTSFIGKERIVELTGEAYFHVKTDKSHPFKVKTQQQETTVFGTQFNISAYADEPKQVVTLAEGKVHVQKLFGEQAAVNLTPGYQAIINHTILTKAANMEEALAWKDGFFLFEEAELSSIMRQLSRWYDVDVVFENKDVKDKFTGKIPRNISLKNVLKVLTYSDVVFRIEGKKIIVL